MKTSDVEYYSDQINSFTPVCAIKKKNYITAVFPDGKKEAAYTEHEANKLWKKCSNVEQK